MQIDDRQFEKTIQSKLAGHEADVRGDLWAAIESKLPQNAPQIATRRVPLYRRIIAYSAAAAAVGIVVAVVWWQTPEKPLVTPIANQLSTEGVEMVQPATNDSEQPPHCSSYSTANHTPGTPGCPQQKGNSSRNSIVVGSRSSCPTG